MTTALIGKKAIGCAAASGAFLAFTWYTKPKPYPPYGWSEQARAFPEHIAAGLGPFQYYCSENGATNNPEDSRMKPGLDAPNVPDTSGIRMFRAEDYTDLESVVARVRENLCKKGVLEGKEPLNPLSVPVSVYLKRNLRDRPFNSIIQFAERRDIEATVVAALEKIFPNDKYHCMHGSRSRNSHGMSLFLQDVLRSKGLLFEAPWTVYDLSCGTGRHWPDARGVFVVTTNGDVDAAVWVNGEDHIEIVAISSRGDVGTALRITQEIASKLETVLSFSKDEINGYLTMKPEEAGTGMKVSCMVSLPNLSKHREFANICSSLRLRAGLVDRPSLTFTLMSVERFGLTPDENAKRTSFSIEKILELENLLGKKSPDADKEIVNILSQTLVRGPSRRS
jgi:hypothetical protein